MISDNVVCATSKGSDQPARMRSLIRAFSSSLYNLRVLYKLLREHHLEFLSLKGGCTGSFESTLKSCQNATLLEITCRGSFVLTDWSVLIS